MRFKELDLIDNKLKDYKNYESYIEQINLQIEMAEIEFEEYNEIDFCKDKLSKTNKINRETENRVLAKQEKIDKLHRRKKIFLIYKKNIELFIKMLSFEEYELFKLLYLNKNKMSRDRILYELHISKDTYYRLKYAILEKARDYLL